MFEKHGDATSRVQNHTKINSLIGISFKARHFNVFPLNHNAMTDLIYSHIYIPLRKNKRLVNKSWISQGAETYSKVSIIRPGRSRLLEFEKKIVQ